MPGHPGHSDTTTRPIATQFSGHGCMYDLTTERSFDSQATWFIFDTLSISVCTTRHWQTSVQLVQELNVGTVTLVFLSAQ